MNNYQTFIQKVVVHRNFPVVCRCFLVLRKEVLNFDIQKAEYKL